MKRRNFVKCSLAGLSSVVLSDCTRNDLALPDPGDRKKFEDIYRFLPFSSIFHITDIPENPFSQGIHSHFGVQTLIEIMGENGHKFYRSDVNRKSSGKHGLIDSSDVVLLKVNAQWKYRGCTNSDLVRGLIQQVLDHPDGFLGEIIIIENGQGRGSLDCDTSKAYGHSEVHANAQDEEHSFNYLVENIFHDPRVSGFLLDPIRNRFIDDDDHITNGYRRFENISYPCFTTPGGRRVELREGIWDGASFQPNLKLINIPVLKHHDTGGSEITAALKHVYGLISMVDGQINFRHYRGLGETCGKWMVSLHTPVLNILDAIWVSHRSLGGYPAETTVRLNQILASQDPVALDYWAAKHILYPIDQNPRHHPDFPGIDRWLSDAEYIINQRGGFRQLERGIRIDRVTKEEERIRLFHRPSLS